VTRDWRDGHALSHTLPRVVTGTGGMGGVTPPTLRQSHAAADPFSVTPGNAAPLSDAPTCAVADALSRAPHPREKKSARVSGGADSSTATPTPGAPTVRRLAKPSLVASPSLESGRFVAPPSAMSHHASVTVRATAFGPSLEEHVEGVCSRALIVSSPRSADRLSRARSHASSPGASVARSIGVSAAMASAGLLAPLSSLRCVRSIRTRPTLNRAPKRAHNATSREGDRNGA
jgi:hypothetical protein